MVTVNNKVYTDVAEAEEKNCKHLFNTKMSGMTRVVHQKQTVGTALLVIIVNNLVFQSLQVHALNAIYVEKALPLQHLLIQVQDINALWVDFVQLVLSQVR